MRQQFPLALTIAMLVLAAGTMTAADSVFGEEHSKLEMAAAAKAMIDDAIKTASGKMSSKVIEAELEKKHHTLVWEIEIVTPENRAMEVPIDAQSGA